MEWFKGKDSRIVLGWVKDGETIVWPHRCRNCEWEYPLELKRMVTKRLTDSHGNVELLEIVSKSVRDLNCDRYCCINNYKPTLPNKSRAFETLNSDRYQIIRPGVVIEKGLHEWTDVSWDDDEDTEAEPPSNGTERVLSLFDI